MRLAASLLLVLAAIATASAAPVADAQRPRDRISLTTPTGPVTVTADRAEVERGGVMLYRGNVRLVSDDLVLSGDRLELRQPERGEFNVVVTGRPARLSHAGQEGAPPIRAGAGRITYDSVTSQVDLSSGAQLERDKDVLTGEHILYDAAARRIQASGGEGSQVRIVIQQPEAGSRDGVKP